MREWKIQVSKKSAERSSKPVPIWPAIRRILRLSGGLRIFLFLALIIDSLMVATLIIRNYYFQRQLYDSVLAKNSQLFWPLVGACITLWLLDLMLVFLRTRSIGRFSEGSLAELRQMIAAQGITLPIKYFELHHSGDTLSILNADLAKIKKTLVWDLMVFIRQFTRGLAALTCMLFISWQLTLIVALLLPLLLRLVSIVTEPISKRSEQLQEEIGKVNSVAQDGLAGLMVTRAFNLTRLLDERFRQANRLALQKGIKIATTRALVDSLSYAAFVTPALVCFGYGGYLTITGQITFGSMMIFTQLLNYVSNPLHNIPTYWASIGEAAGAAQRLFHIFDQTPERQDGIVQQPHLDAESLVQFNNVSFAYQPDTPVLEHVSFGIKRGEKIALVGTSGSGKTTILKLLLGFYPIEEGRISLLGSNISDWHLSSLRQQMAFVSQDTYLFPVSIGDNIACGKPGSSQAEIERAAQAANIHNFILTLPELYATPVGERGARLSGGERQRISLARAILKDAPLLLLDEATSALDTESEALVQQAVDRFMVGRTTVVIAHRLSTIKNVDRILVLDRGQIVETGTHAELFACGGLYRTLYETQFVNSRSSPSGISHDKKIPLPHLKGVSHA